MKILFITQNLAPFRLKWLEELANYSRIEVIYFLNHDNKNNTNRHFFSEKPNHVNANLVKGIFIIKMFRVIKTILSGNYDYIILDGYGFKEQILLIIVLKFIKHTFFMSIDGGWIKKEPFVKYYIKRYIVNSAEYYFSTSEETDKYLQYYGIKKEQCLRHIFSSLSQNDIKNIHHDKKVYRKELGIDAEKMICLYVGKIIESKGILTILACAKALPEVEFYLVGGTPTEGTAIFEHAKKLKNIYFVEFCDSVKLQKYYLMADVFVFPTYADVWGLALVEALIYKLPVITTNMCNSGVALIKEKINGFIIEVNDVLSLTQILKKLDLEILNTISENNTVFSRIYTVNNAAQEDIKILRKLKFKPIDL